MAHEPAKWAPGLLMAAIFWALGLIAKVGDVEQDLAARSKQALATTNLDNLTLSAAGRDIALSGVAFTPEGADGALRSVLAVNGVRLVDVGQVTLIPEAKPYVWSATKEGDAYALAGSAPDLGARTEILAAAKSIANANVSNSMDYRRGDAAALAPSAKFALNELAHFSKGSAVFSDGALTIQGAGLDLENVEAAADALKSLPAGVTVAKAEITAPVGQPYVFDAVKSADGLHLTGYVPSLEDRRTLDQTAGSLSKSVTDDTRVVAAGSYAAGYGAATAFALAELARLSQGEVSLSDANLTIKGVAIDAESRQSAEAALTALPPGLTLVSSLIEKSTSERDAEAVAQKAAEEAAAQKAADEAAAQKAADEAAAQKAADEAAAQKAADEAAAKKAADEAAAQKAADEAAAQKAADEAAAQKAADEAAAQKAADEAAAKKAADEAAAQKAADEAAAQKAADEAAAQKAADEAAAQKAAEEAAAKKAADEAAAQKAAEEAAAQKAADEAAAQKAAEKAAAQKAADEAAAKKAADVAAAQKAAEEAAAQKAAEEAAAKKVADETATETATAARVGAANCVAELNEVLAAGTIVFDTGMATVSAASSARVAKLAEVAKRCKVASITISGHTDNTGDPSLNQGLSRARAETVLAIFVRSGVPSGELSALGFGASKPVASNDTEEGRARNRRIEFEVR